MKDILDELTKVQAENDCDIIIERGKTVQKRLVAELMAIPGVDRMQQYVDCEEDEFSAATFYNEHLSPLHESCDSLYFALQNVKGFALLRRSQNPKSKL